MKIVLRAEKIWRNRLAILIQDQRMDRNPWQIYYWKKKKKKKISYRKTEKAYQNSEKTVGTANVPEIIPSSHV